MDSLASVSTKPGAWNLAVAARRATYPALHSKHFRAYVVLMIGQAGGRVNRILPVAGPVCMKQDAQRSDCRSRYSPPPGPGLCMIGAGGRGARKSARILPARSLRGAACPPRPGKNMIAFDQSACSNLEFALQREWLETNGLGGYASSTIAGCHTRRYHGLLIASITRPAGRFVRSEE